MTGEVFHVLNRGVDKRKIFFDEKDYFRFVYNLYDFNDKSVSLMSYRNRRKFDNSAIRWPNKKKDQLVDILCWCLMPNHYHILLQEKVDGGAGIFSKKLSGGYTQYFNLKNKRSGVLFQGKSKIIQVKKDEHFMYLPFYIFSNPVKLMQADWKERGLKNVNQTGKFLEGYKWSSYLNIIGGNNFSFVINRKSFFELFDSSEDQFQKYFKEWLFGYRMAE